MMLPHEALSKIQLIRTLLHKYRWTTAIHCQPLSEKCFPFFPNGEAMIASDQSNRLHLFGNVWLADNKLIY